MATITENLKKILSAVYGKDVRQAIHDSIEQCEKDMESGIAKCREDVESVHDAMNTILDHLVETIEVTPTEGVAWFMVRGTIYEETGSYYSGVKLSVSAGETYRIVTYRGDSDSSYYLDYPVIAAAEGGDGTLRLVKAYDKSLVSDTDTYMVTVPEGSDLLLISNVALIGEIQVGKLRV